MNLCHCCGAVWLGCLMVFASEGLEVDLCEVHRRNSIDGYWLQQDWMLSSILGSMSRRDAIAKRTDEPLLRTDASL